jgi:hypothetical protein
MRITHHECLNHYLDLFHLCNSNSKIVDTEEPITNKPHQAAAQVGLQTFYQNIFLLAPVYTAAAQLWGLPKDFRTSERVAIPSDGHPERTPDRSPRPLRYVFSAGGPMIPSFARAESTREHLQCSLAYSHTTGGIST